MVPESEKISCGVIKRKKTRVFRSYGNVVRIQGNRYFSSKGSNHFTVISHPLPTNSSDGKNVHTVKFISRKTKFNILSAKKAEENRNFKFRNNDVFINEHLSPTNRSLFAAANGKKRQLGYKFCWTKGGKILMRKTEESEVISIKCQSDLNNLA